MWSTTQLTLLRKWNFEKWRISRLRCRTHLLLPLSLLICWLLSCLKPLPTGSLCGFQDVWLKGWYFDFHCATYHSTELRFWWTKLCNNIWSCYLSITVGKLICLIVTSRILCTSPSVPGNCLNTTINLWGAARLLSSRRLPKHYNQPVRCSKTKKRSNQDKWRTTRITILEVCDNEIVYLWWSWIVHFAS